MGGFAWVTLATNDSYSLGALVLAHSLRQLGTVHKLAVLVTPGVTDCMRQKLSTIFDVVQEVDILNSRDEANLKLLQRPELGITFTKLHCWRLTQFEKCVFLDADTLVLQNCDELFDRDEFSAAPDVGWPDCFNSGVFVYKPSNDTYENLIKFALEKGSFDGGDQGLLNLYYSDWAHKDISKHLPFIYNMCSTASYSYLPAYKQFGDNVKIVHFIGSTKPWLQYFNSETCQVHPSPGLQHLHSVLQRWWNIFCSLIHPNLSSEMARGRSTNVHLYSYINQTPYYNPSTHYDSEYFTEIALPNLESNSSVNDYTNVWDPWDNYKTETDIHVPNEPVIVQEKSTIDVEPFESHNKNAQNIDEVVFHSPKPHHHNQPQLTAPAPILPQPQVNASSQLHNIINCPQTCSEPSNTTQTESRCDIIKSKCTPVIPNPAPQHKHESTSIVATECTLHEKDKEATEHDAGLAGALAQVTLGAPRSAGQDALEDHLRRQGWEVGNIDYLGVDSFDNIWKKICATLATAPAPAPSSGPQKTREPTPPSASQPVEPITAPAKVETQILQEIQKEEIPEKPAIIASVPNPVLVGNMAEVSSPLQEKKQEAETPVAASQMPEENTDNKAKQIVPFEASPKEVIQTVVAPKPEPPLAEPVSSTPAAVVETPKSVSEALACPIASVTTQIQAQTAISPEPILASPAPTSVGPAAIPVSPATTPTSPAPVSISSVITPASPDLVSESPIQAASPISPISTVQTTTPTSPHSQTPTSPVQVIASECPVVPNAADSVVAPSTDAVSVCPTASPAPISTQSSAPIQTILPTEENQALASAPVSLESILASPQITSPPVPVPQSPVPASTAPASTISEPTPVIPLQVLASPAPVQSIPPAPAPVEKSTSTPTEASSPASVAPATPISNVPAQTSPEPISACPAQIATSLSTPSETVAVLPKSSSEPPLQCPISKKPPTADEKVVTPATPPVEPTKQTDIPDATKTPIVEVEKSMAAEPIKQMEEAVKPVQSPEKTEPEKSTTGASSKSSQEAPKKDGGAKSKPSKDAKKPEVAPSQQKTAQKSGEPAISQTSAPSDSAASPTPPPRKGSGGAKKSKAKK